MKRDGEKRQEEDGGREGENNVEEILMVQLVWIELINIWERERENHRLCPVWMLNNL